MQLARPVESGISKEEQVVDHQSGQWADNLRVLLSDSWGCDGVKNKQAHLEHLLLPKDGLGSLLCVRVGSEESEVVGQVELQELDVLLILADGLKLGLKVIDGLDLHDFLGNLSRHRKRLQESE